MFKKKAHTTQASVFASRNNITYDQCLSKKQMYKENELELQVCKVNEQQLKYWRQLG